MWNTQYRYLNGGMERFEDDRAMDGTKEEKGTALSNRRIRDTAPILRGWRNLSKV
jgi:hypothetical protein